MVNRINYIASLRDLWFMVYVHSTNILPLWGSPVRDKILVETKCNPKINSPVGT
jgi:hypothetical protein